MFMKTLPSPLPDRKIDQHFNPNPIVDLLKKIPVKFSYG